MENRAETGWIWILNRLPGCFPNFIYINTYIYIYRCRTLSPAYGLQAKSSSNRIQKKWLKLLEPLQKQQLLQLTTRHESPQIPSSPTSTKSAGACVLAYEAANRELLRGPHAPSNISHPTHRQRPRSVLQHRRIPMFEDRKGCCMALWVKQLRHQKMIVWEDDVPNENGWCPSP
jgi:hypothetical protein